MDRAKGAMQEVREKGQAGSRGYGTMQRQRETQVNKLLQQLIRRKQTAVLLLEGGRKVAGVQKVREELAKFWYSVMTSPDVAVQECEEFIRGLDPPKVWTEALARLRRRPSEDIKPPSPIIRCASYYAFAPYYCLRRIISEIAYQLPGCIDQMSQAQSGFQP